MEIFESRKHETRRKHERTYSQNVLRFEELSSRVIGAALAVHREIGPGFVESVYHSAMRVSLLHRAISFESEVPIEIAFGLGEPALTW
jgi:hypothetical protein